MRQTIVLLYYFSLSFYLLYLPILLDLYYFYSTYIFYSSAFLLLLFKSVTMWNVTRVSLTFSTSFYIATRMTTSQKVRSTTLLIHTPLYRHIHTFVSKGLLDFCCFFPVFWKNVTQYISVLIKEVVDKLNKNPLQSSLLSFSFTS